VIAGLGYMFDAMDVAVVAFVLSVIKTQWLLPDQKVGVLAAAAAIGGFFGSVTAGVLGDVIGRRAVMMWALTIYCAASLASALSSTWGEFFGWRVVAGVGVYAESAVIASFLSEFAGPSFRGRYVGSLTGFFGLGFVLAALVGYVVVPLAPPAWRYALIITALPVGLLLWWRRSLPESPRWLESRGRLGDAELIVSGIEKEFRDRVGELPAIRSGDTPQVLANDARSFRSSCKRLFMSPLLRATSMGLIVWFSIGFSYYAFFTWIPSLLVENGMSTTKSYSYSLVMYFAQLPGYFTAAALNDIIGRQAVIASYMILAGIASLAFGLARRDGDLIVLGLCLSFFLNGTYAGLYAYTPELFPTEVRATALGIASSLSRIGAIISPIAVGLIFPRWGFPGVFGMTCVILLGGALSVIFLGTSTYNRPLEEIGVT
jgi:MFS transporter, putative metabolite:H+ symporter